MDEQNDVICHTWVHPLYLETQSSFVRRKGHVSPVVVSCGRAFDEVARFCHHHNMLPPSPLPNPTIHPQASHAMKRSTATTTPLNLTYQLLLAAETH